MVIMSRLKRKFESQVDAESHELCSPKFLPADPSSIPFEEWSDSDINIEKWEFDKDTKEETELFRDPQVVHLPPSLHGVEWKRPSEIFSDTTFTIFLDGPNPPDLIGGSKHLLHSEFIRGLIHGVATLCHAADAGRLPAEYVCPQFCPPSGGRRPWRPWHHVYSNCRAGHGEPHHPMANKSGKYIVRLFWLGSWKKIYVDDLLPVNADNEVLLPILPLPKDQLDSFRPKKSPSEKPRKKPKTPDIVKSKSLIGNKKVIELWPFLLAKALMKLASLTWDSSHDLVDFDIIQCLSGWIPYKINTRGMNTDDIWDICMKYTSHYEWQDPKSRSMSRLNSSKSQLSARDKSIKPKIANLRSKDDVDKYSLAICFQHAECTMTECGTHCSMIEQTRNIPLVKPSREEDFPLWKRYRWLDWAIENDILPPKASTTPIRCLKLVDPFRASCNRIYGEEKSNEGTFVKAGSTRELSRKGNESKRLGFGLQLNLASWLDFGQVFENIMHLIVYFKPLKFPVKVRLSDLCSKTLHKELRYPILKTLEDSMALEWKEIIRPQTSMYYKNEPVFVLSDSLSSRTVIINFAQVGSPQVLEDKTGKNTRGEKLQTSDSECGICLSTILERLKKKNAEKPDERDKKKVIRVIPNEYHDRVQGHLVLCKFKWYSEHVDDVVNTMRTYATSTMVLNLMPGRHLFRLFIKSSTAYVTQILSNAPLCVGYLEEIYPLMAEETLLVTKRSEVVAKSFQDLAKSFGKEDYLEKLRYFYDSYKPQCELDKVELLEIHETFYKELLHLVAENLNKAELNAIRILLKQWQFPSREYDREDTLGFCFEPDADDMEYVEIMKKATVVIQAFLRGVYERQMMKRHSLTNKHHKATVESLLRIHSLLSTKGITLLRHCNLHPDVSHVTERGCYDDINNAITLYQFSNSTRVSSEDWNLIYRHTFYVLALHPIPIRISMFCDLDRYSVRVFDNDEGHEMKIHTDNVSVNMYPSNAKGYTVLCYGSSSMSKQLYYKLCYVVPKETDEKLLHFLSDSTKKEVVSGNYIPTKRNSICRYMIIAQSEEVSLTLHFSTNYSKVKINLRLFKDNELLREVEGRGSVLLPIILLGYKGHDRCKKIYAQDSAKSINKKSTSKALHKARNRYNSSNPGSREKLNELINEVYFMEATVIDDSWPLTAAEWRVVERLRAEKLWGGPNKIIEKGSTTKKYSSIAEIQKPYWTLQLITDYVDMVKLSRDDKRDIEMRLMKMRWNENDPTRYEKSEELRNTFITENQINNEEICQGRGTRSCNPEIFKEKILPPFETYCDKYRKISDGERELKDAVKIEKDIEDEFKQLVRFREWNENETQKMEEMGTLHVDNYNLTKNWYNECRMESEEMMEDAYKAKLKYIENVSKSTTIVKGKEKKEKKTTTKSKKK